jgi:hypothetical protein
MNGGRVILNLDACPLSIRIRAHGPSLYLWCLTILRPRNDVANVRGVTRCSVFGAQLGTLSGFDIVSPISTNPPLVSALDADLVCANGIHARCAGHATELTNGTAALTLVCVANQARITRLSA